MKLNALKHLKLPSIFLVLVFLLFSISLSRAADSSPDAIAFRVIPNPEHSSPLRWYREHILKQGNPQSLLVDGYEAVREGRTVYVNAANVDGANMYTNIYIISYNQNPESATMDIFGKILSKWKFNTNLASLGSCTSDVKTCSSDSECPAGYSCVGAKCQLQCLGDAECPSKTNCTSQKAGVVRDTRRLSDLREIKIALDDYKDAKGHYPILGAGTYLANKTISVWPSWKQNLGKELDINIPEDPINKLGPCADSLEKNGNIYDSSDNISCIVTDGNSVSSCYINAFEYSFDVVNNLEYKAFIETTNYNSSVYGDLNGYVPPASVPSEDICPSEGIQHHIKISVDGSYKGYVCNQAVGPDKPHQRGEVYVGTLAPGNHTIRYEWDNDWTYDPDGTWGNGDEVDSNWKIYRVGIVGNSYDPITCWDELKKEFADADPDPLIFKMPENSSVYVYTGRYDGADYNICGIMNSGFITTAAAGACAGSASVQHTGTLNNNPPVIICTKLTGAPNTEFKGLVHGYDPDNNKITWVGMNTGMSSWDGWSAAPIMKAGGSINEKQIYAASAGNPGKYQIEITATDDRGGIASQKCEISISATQPPVINPPDCTATAMVGDPYDACLVTGTDPGGGTVTFNFSGLPPGITGDPITGVISGTPTVSGTYTVVITAKNSTGQLSLPASFILTVISFCGDKVKQSPNSQGTGGPADDGYEDCDYTSGVALTAADSSSSKQYKCSIACVYEGGYCGNAIIESPYETCESAGGGTGETDQYGCAACKWSDGYCGDKIKQSVYGEECDGEGGLGTGITDQYECDNSACKTKGGFCGNKIIESAYEECDTDPIYHPTTGVKLYDCGSDCKTLGGFCGDSIIQYSLGEECEGLTGGGTSESDQYDCGTDCQSYGGWCGNKSIEAAHEDCDTYSGKGTSENDQYECSSLCTWQGGFCGNSQIEVAYGEECDKSTPGGTGPSDEYVCGADCRTSGGYCGDSLIQPAYGEECDANNLGGKTCSDFGSPIGTLKCDNCKMNKSECCSVATTDLNFDAGTTSVTMYSGNTVSLNLPPCVSIAPNTAKLTAASGITPISTAVVFVTDTSGSISADSMIAIKNALVQSIGSFSDTVKKGAVVSAGLVRFSDNTSIYPASGGLVDLGDDAQVDLMYDEIDGYVPNGGTNTQKAIDDAYAMLASFSAANKIMILLTDGVVVSNLADVNAAATSAKNSGIKIYTIAYISVEAYQNYICGWSSDNGIDCFTGNFSWKGTSNPELMYGNIVSNILNMIKGDVDISVNSSFVNFSFGAELEKEVVLDLSSVTCSASVQPLQLSVTYDGTQSITLKDAKIDICTQ